MSQLNYGKVFEQTLTASTTFTITLSPGQNTLDLFNGSIWSLELQWGGWPTTDHIPARATIKGVHAPPSYTMNPFLGSFRTVTFATDSSTASPPSILTVYAYGSPPVKEETSASWF